MHAEHVHEHTNAGAHVSSDGVLALVHADDTPVSRAYGNIFILRHNSFRITEEMAGKPCEHHEDHSHGPTANEGKNEGAKSTQANDGPAFRGQSYGSGAHIFPFWGDPREKGCNFRISS